VRSSSHDAPLRDIGADWSGSTLLTSVKICTAPLLSDVSGLAGATALRHLFVSGCPLIPTASLRGIGERCTDLETLNLCSYGTAGLLVDDISFFASATSKLKTIDVSGLPKLTSRGLRGLQLCPVLEKLTIAGCPLVDDVSFLAASRSIKELAMDRCSAVSSRNLSAFSSNDVVETLSVGGPLITDVDFAFGMTRLKQLSINDANVGEQQVIELRNAKPGCRVNMWMPSKDGRCCKFF
jgi:hypothetical protein